jgi:hypothetical protein
MTPQSRRAFLVLILAQAAHSTEEYVFRLFDVFAPARFVSSLVSDDWAAGFALVNAGLVLFGLWCCAVRVRAGHASARAFAWCWMVLEFANGVGHSALALSRGGTFPGSRRLPWCSDCQPISPSHFSGQSARDCISVRSDPPWLTCRYVWPRRRAVALSRLVPTRGLSTFAAPPRPASPRQTAP